jgi:hypothetical protein
MSFSSRNLRFAVCKTESVAGTPEWDLAASFPADADFDNRLFEITITPQIDIDEDVANIATGDHGELNAIVGKQACQIAFSMPLQWGGAVATAPNWSKLMSACGLYENTYTTTGIGWQPLKQMDNTTLTIAVFDMDLGGATPGATTYLFAGCAGNAVITAENNGKWMVNFTFTGKFVDIITVLNANIPETTGFDTSIAERLLNATVSINSVTQFISGFSLDLGNDIQPVIDQSEVTGYEYHYIAARKPRFSFNPLQQAVATDDVHARLLDMSDYPLSMVTASSNITLYAPRAQLLPYTIAEREGLVSWEQNYILQRNNNGSAAIEALIPDEATFELLQGART